MHNVIEAAFPWLTVLIVVALVGALLLWLVKPLRGHAIAFGVGLSGLILALFVGAAAGFDFDAAGRVQLAEDYSWIPQIGASVAWGVNGMGLVMVGLAVFLVPLVLLAAAGDFKGEAPDRAAGYVGWVLALEAVMIGIFSARDVFLFYVLFELMILPMYFLIGRYGGEGASRAAVKFVLYSLFGGLVMLVGVVALAARAEGPKGLLFESAAQAASGNGMLVFLTFFAAFAIKAPMFPVHTWLPDAAEKAPAGTSTLLVGVLDKVGTYGMIALCLPIAPDAAKSAAVPVMVFAVISIFWGAFMAIASNDLMRLIAYTSVSHFGFIVLGVFSGSSTAMTGAIVYMVAHGVATGALFLTVGFLRRRGGDALITTYGGWQRVTPVIAGVFLVSGLATIALPGLSGFVPEYLVLMGTFKVHGAFALVAVLGVILAAVYVLLPYQRIFTGPKPDVAAPDLDAREKTVAGILVAAMLALGFFPSPLVDAVKPTAVQSSTVAIEGSAK